MRCLRPGLAPALLLCGCVELNPELDYDRAVDRIITATGQDAVYRPEHDAIVAERVVSLMADGVTTEEAVQICLLNNPTLQAAFFNVGMARADVAQSGLLSNPTLGMSLRLPSGGGLANLEASIAQNIATLWQIPVRKRAAQRSLDRAILALARQATTLAAETKRVYFTVVAARQMLGIARENLEIAQEMLRLTVARKEAGAGSELDVNLSRGLVAEAELAVETSRLAADNGLRSLATLLGISGVPATIEPIDPLPPPPSTDLDGEALLTVARNHRLDLQSAQEAVAVADARLAQEWRQVFPNVSVGVSMERVDQKSDPSRNLLAETARASIAAGALSPPDLTPRSDRQFDARTILGPSLNMTLPVFDQNQAQIARAALVVHQASKTLAALEQSVAQAVRGAVDQTMTAWRVARLYASQFVPLAEKNLNLARESYRAGKTPYLTVLQAQRFFLDSRSRHVAALQSAAQTLPELEQTIGLPMDALSQAVEDGAVTSERDECETKSDDE